MIEKIEQDLKQAMLARESTRVSVLRSLLNALKSQAKDKQRELTDQEVIAVLNKEAKQRDEASIAFEKGGAKDRAEAEQAERAIIDEYLPHPLSDDELDTLITEVVAEIGAEQKNMGQIISTVIERSEGRVEGGRVAAKVRGRLTT